MSRSLSLDLSQPLRWNPPMAENPTTLPTPGRRLASLDAYRGFVMFLMAAELLRVPSVAAHFPGSGIWETLKFHSSHVAWTGCSLHDLIQPSFSFMVGVALPFSIASRITRGQSKGTMVLHALWRALLLTLLGVFLRSDGHPMTRWTFEDTLSQIGMGYPFLFLLGFAGNVTRWVTLAAILVGYWLFFVLGNSIVPFFLHLAPQDLNLANSVPPNWEHDFDGFASHWNINRNSAWAFDVWFLNLFQREQPFTGNPGGYSTLSFIPTLGTMILGLIAGTWLKNSTKREESAAEDKTDASASVINHLTMAAIICLVLGWALHVSSICPSVKKIWTPSWTLFSGGWCFLLMAGFYFIIDVQGWRRWAFPLVVIGMNSIAMYVMDHTITGFISSSLRTHLGKDAFKRIAGWLYPDPAVFEPMIAGACVLLILWLILLWMHRRKIYLRI